jgi:uracil-DNA glycosylase family protein
MLDKPATTIAALRHDAESCERCDLYRHATQTVFGEGFQTASIVLVGEQPGDKEDLAGRPFVGPAGRVLDECLNEAGVDRSKCYVTNTVKHFKFSPRGKRRMHSKPNAGEIQRCSWWLTNELRIIKPKIVVALGATAASFLVGNTVRITRDRGTIFHPDKGMGVLVTVHPSYILRIRDKSAADKERAKLVEDFILLHQYEE